MPLVPPKVTLGLAPAVPLLPASGGLGFLRRMLRRGLGLFGAEVLSFPLSSSGTPGPQRLENPLPGGSAATPTPPEPGGSLSQPAPVQELLIQGLSKRFNGAEWALRDFSLEVHRGELLCVLGPSGCGKTTLLRLIAGLDAPTRGLVQREGEVLSSPEGMVPPEHRRMGMVFQDYALFPHLSVLDNVRFGLELPPWQRALNWVRLLLGQQQATAAHRMDGLVELLNLTGLTDMTGRYPHELSGGQQQRVALARALATHPRLVLMDEPFSNLDATLRTRLRDEVKDVLHRAGATTLLVTHDQEEAINMGDRLAIMNGGKLEQIGTPEEVLERPASRFVAEFLGFTRCLPGTVKGEWIHTELGVMPLPKVRPPEALEGSTLDVLIRPGQVRLAPGTGVLARVERIHYMAGMPLVTLRLPSGARIEAFSRRTTLPAEGGLVPVQWLEHSPVLFRPR